MWRDEFAWVTADACVYNKRVHYHNHMGIAIGQGSGLSPQPSCVALGKDCRQLPCCTGFCSGSTRVTAFDSAGLWAHRDPRQCHARLGVEGSGDGCPNHFEAAEELPLLVTAVLWDERLLIKKFLVRVDVTEEFPFLVTEMSPYYDR